MNIYYIYERVSNPILKKHNFFLMNIEYIYEFYIEKILCYPFKLKYWNQKVFLSYIEKT
jgi:hypothetical protein